MGKGFRGRTCVYCGGEGTSHSADHVFAREFFPIEQRANLPKVPACALCNQAKSVLEHYLLSVLPFGGRHPDASSILSATVPRRLGKNAKLYRELSAKRGRAWLEENGVIRPTMTLPIDAEKLIGLFVLITRGLVAHHWQEQIPGQYHIGAGLLTKAGESIIGPLLASNSRQRVMRSLGDGLVEYEGAQAFDDPYLTIWRFSLYGGIRLAGDPRVSTEAPSYIWSISARDPLPDVFGES